MTGIGNSRLNSMDCPTPVLQLCFLHMLHRSQRSWVISDFHCGSYSTEMEITLTWRHLAVKLALLDCPTLFCYYVFCKHSSSISLFLRVIIDFQRWKKDRKWKSSLGGATNLKYWHHSVSRPLLSYSILHTVIVHLSPFTIYCGFYLSN